MSQLPTEPEPSPAEVKGRRAAERLGVAFLLYRDHVGSEHIYTLEDSTYRKVLIGRDAAADVSLAWDKKVSATHAEIERVGDDWALIDDDQGQTNTEVGRRWATHFNPWSTRFYVIAGLYSKITIASTSL